MDVVLICFSQTGSTRQVATAMVGAFRGAAHSARTISLKKATPEDATQGDLLGVGTPCFSSRAPTPIKEFVRALPRLDGQPAFVFATASGAPGRVLYDLTSLLRSKGADVLGGFLARGQVHHPAPHMTGQFPGRPNAQDLTRARRFAVALAEHVSAGRSGPLPKSRPGALKRRWGFYDFVGLAGSDRLLRLFMPEPKLNPDKCDRCRRCVYECPMDNITLRSLDPSTSPGHSGLGTVQAQGRFLQSYPVLGDRCIRCYRCLTGCPQRAFDVNWRLADPFLLFLYNASFMRRFGDLEPGEQIY
jgi:NAD-dependent dihydropyrimidine dehydrogenase PreA subunit/flavodoxin